MIAGMDRTGSDDYAVSSEGHSTTAKLRAFSILKRKCMKSKSLLSLPQMTTMQIAAACLISQANKFEFLTKQKQQVQRRQCVSCGTKLGEGRAGRKCLPCRNPAQATGDEVVVTQ